MTVLQGKTDHLPWSGTHGYEADASSADHKGFTLMEILVVIAILGFVLAMAAPRLAGMTSESADTADSMSARKLHELVTLYNGKHGGYPDDCINEVTVDSLGLYHRPLVSDQDQENGPEVLTSSCQERCRFHVHYLNDAEKKELERAGVIHLLNLNSAHDTAFASKGPAMDRIVPAGLTDVAVLMTGGGDENNDGVIEVAETDSGEPGWSFPGVQFRIVLGIGFDSALIKEGFALNPGYCANSISYDDGSFRAYSILLPRLSATSARLKKDNPLGGSGSFTFFKTPSSATIEELRTAERQTVDLYEAMNPAFFDIICAEGVRFHPGSGPRETWGADFNRNGAID